MLTDQTNKYAASSSPSDLEECPSCGRKFNESAYEKHVKIC
jgi:hypothetical protein